MSSDESVNNARIFITNIESTRHLFIALRDYYRGTNLGPLLNVLEACILNTITDREVFIKLFTEVLRRNEIKEEVMTAIHDETHKTMKELKEFKDKDVHGIIKEYLGGIDNG